MNGSPVLVLAAGAALREGESARFGLVLDGVRREAFVMRWRGEERAWLNTCRHQGLALDFGDGRLLEEGGAAIVCVHHGARYQPDTGECVEGPCRGASLTSLALERRPDGLWCTGRAGRPGPIGP